MVSFQATRNVILVEDKANVLHYFGTSFRELKRMVRSEKPDLVVINSSDVDIDEEELQFCNYVIDIVTCDKDIYGNQAVNTNNAQLCQLYYRKLGLQRKMNVYYKEQEPVSEHTAGKLWLKFVKFMRWA